MANNAARQRELMFMFERVGESLTIPRDNRKVKYDIPRDFYSQEFTTQSSVIVDRFSAAGLDENAIIISVQPLAQKPDLSTVMQVAKRQNFSLFAPVHQRAAGALISLLMNAPNYEAFKSLACYTHEQANAELWTYCYAVAITNRPDLLAIQVPSLSEVSPNKCVPAATLQSARETASMLGEDNREPLIVPPTFTADEKHLEQRLAYFREDVGINLHHWHWHLVYPNSGPEEVVRKDRRGELFYYMHQQIIARYNVERLCNDLNFVAPLDSFREPIREGYYSKLDNVLAGRVWQGRPDNMPLQPINRDDLGAVFNAEVLEGWVNRLQEAIARGQVQDTNGQTIELSEQNGIDILGNLVENSQLSVNSSLYGNLHNFLHVIISLCHDPDRSHLEDVGVLGDVATAMRDPAFYRLHARVNNIFKSHKDVLPQYAQPQLSFNGIRILTNEVRSEGSSQPNALETYWETSDIQLNRGLDFSDRGNTFARIQYLQHNPFTYHIMVENTTNAALQGTVRIFIGPRRGENKRDITFDVQRGLMIEMDKFVQQLQPGVNEIRRRSDQSSVTIPYEQTFRRLMDNIEQNTAEENYCGCGWPQNMLIPKGSPNGVEFELFVMVSNWQDDQVPPQNPQQSAICKNAVSMCGARGQNYPDRRSMGFPFDRATQNTPLLSEFARNYPNMSISRFVIRHLPDRVVQKQPARRS